MAAHFFLSFTVQNDPDYQKKLSDAMDLPAHWEQKIVVRQQALNAISKDWLAKHTKQDTAYQDELAYAKSLSGDARKQAFYDIRVNYLNQAETLYRDIATAPGTEAYPVLAGIALTQPPVSDSFMDEVLALKKDMTVLENTSRKTKKTQALYNQTKMSYECLTLRTDELVMLVYKAGLENFDFNTSIRADMDLIASKTKAIKLPVI